MNILKFIEKKEIKKLNLNLNLNFLIGDYISVDTIIIESNKKKLQNFSGIVIAKFNKNINSSFIIRKISKGIGVEKTFQTYSPLINKITVKIKNKIKKSKLYYLRKFSKKFLNFKK